MTPFLRLVLARPTPEAVEDRVRVLERRIEINYADPNLYAPGEMTWHIGRELSREGSYVKYVATYLHDYQGQSTVVLHVREGELEDGDKPLGTCELGVVLYIWDYYEFGTDLVTLRDSGFRLSWIAAQWLYDVARLELVDAHHTGGNAHGALTARKCRLVLFNEVEFSGTKPSKVYQSRHHADQIPPPLHYLHGTGGAATDTARAEELSVLAFAVAELTNHPDPTIDRLLRDCASGSQEVLRDVLLDRGEPVELLLRDRSMTPSLELLPLPGAEDDAIDRELRALWYRAIELDPMLDHDDPKLVALPHPTLEDVSEPIYGVPARAQED